MWGRWAHMLGYCGHAATKSRAYSTTYGKLREERRVYQDAERRQAQGLPSLDGRNASGLVHGEAPIVDAIRASQRHSWST